MLAYRKILGIPEVYKYLPDERWVDYELHITQYRKDQRKVFVRHKCHVLGM
jgi:hypothetical protein